MLFSYNNKTVLVFVEIYYCNFNSEDTKTLYEFFSDFFTHWKMFRDEISSSNKWLKKFSDCCHLTEL